MTHDDTERFAAMMTLLGATFGRSVGADTIEGFWIALGDLDVDELEAAAHSWMRTGRRFPTPADLRELTRESTEASALEAWEGVLRLAANSRSAKHPDPVAEECVRQLGGWLALGQQTSDQLTVWTRKQFLDLYISGAPRDRVQRQVEARGPLAEISSAIAASKAIPGSSQ